MTDPTPIADFVVVDKDHKFIRGDVVTFVFINPEAKMTDITPNSLVGLVDRVEDRYITLRYSLEPTIPGKLVMVNLNRSMVVKMNGYSRVSSMGMDGVNMMDLPLADVVNIDTSIIIKSMKKRTEEKL